MNEMTRQRLESDTTNPAPTQPVDKLRLSEARTQRLATVRGVVSSYDCGGYVF